MIPKQLVISHRRNKPVKPVAGDSSELRLTWPVVSATRTQPRPSTPQPSFSSWWSEWEEPLWAKPQSRCGYDPEWFSGVWRAKPKSQSRQPQVGFSQKHNPLHAYHHTHGLHLQDVILVFPTVPRQDLRILHNTETSRLPRPADQSRRTRQNVSVTLGSQGIWCPDNGYYELGCVLQKVIYSRPPPDGVMPLL